MPLVRRRGRRRYYGPRKAQIERNAKLLDIAIALILREKNIILAGHRISLIRLIKPKAITSFYSIRYGMTYSVFNFVLFLKFFLGATKSSLLA